MAESTSRPGLEASKDDWREWARSVRRTLDYPTLSAKVIAGLQGFPPLRHPVTVLIYLPMDDEIDLTGLTERRLPVRWVTTRTPDEGSLTIHELGGPLEMHALGFPQPTAKAPHVSPADVDVALMPGLAFDLYGNRLGRGMGYFDELLSRLRAGIVRVGIVPTALVADRLPKEEHDVPVQWLASEEGVVGVAY